MSLKDYSKYRGGLNTASFSSQTEDALAKYKNFRSNMDEPQQTVPKPVFGPERPAIKYPNITTADVNARLKEEQLEHNKRIKALESTQKMFQNPNSMLYSGAPNPVEISKQKQELLKTTPTAESVRKKLLAEQGKKMVMDDSNNEQAWLQFTANTLDPASFQKYQVDPEYQKLVKANYAPEIQHDKIISNARANIDKKYTGVQSDVDKIILQSLSDWWLQTKATGNTLKGLFGDKASLQKGAQQFEQSAINREAISGKDLTNAFLYDLTSIAPDMLTMVGVGAGLAKAGVKTGAQSITKATFKGLMNKETRKAAVISIGQALAVSPETVPLGTKIFAQSYQDNLADGMSDKKAFFTAFVNAYGQSLLEKGGINQLMGGEAGKTATVKYLKAAFGEGAEEITQDMWESAVDRIIAGKDVKFYSQDPNESSLINPTRQTRAFTLGAVAGGGMSAGMAGAEVGANLYAEKTRPEVSLEDPTGKMEEYAGKMQQYQKDMEGFELPQGAPEQTIEDVNPQAHRYETYSKKELVHAAKQVSTEAARAQRVALIEARDNAADMKEWEAFQNAIESTTPESVVKAVSDGTAISEVMDVVQRQAFKSKPQPELEPVINPMAKLEQLAFEEPKKPELPEIKLDVDTSKMAKPILAKMEADVRSLGETANKVIEMAAEGKTRSEIAKSLQIAPKAVRSTLLLNGVPDVKSPKFRAWQAIHNYSKARQVAKPETVKPVVSLLEESDAQQRLDKVRALKVSGAKVATNLEPGHTYVQKLGKTLGVDVVFYEGGNKNIRGVFSPKETRTVFISKEQADSGEATMSLLGHEFLHSVQENHKDLYDTLRDVMRDNLTTDKVKKQISKYSLDADYQKSISEDKELMIEEILADEAGSLFTDKQFWQNVYEKDATVAQKLIRLIRDFLDRVLGTKIDSGNMNVMTELQVKEFQSKFEDAVAEIIKRESYSDKIADKFKVSEKEANIGGAALEDLNEKFSVKRTRTVARDYTKKFLNDGSVNLIGQTIKQPVDLAVMAQVYRDPRFETIRYFFVNIKGEVIYHTGVSSRLPGVTLIYSGKSEVDYFNKEFGKAVDLGATGFYIMHNHPSGDPTPSQEDINVTVKLSRSVRALDMLGHIIVNSKKFSLIDNYGQTHTRDLDVKDKLLVPDKPHSVLGTKITSPDVLAGLGKATQRSEGYSSVIYLAPSLKVRGIQEIPSTMVGDIKKMTTFLSKNATAFGGSRVVLIAENESVYTSAEYYVKNSYFLDVVHGETFATMRDQGVEPETSKGKYFGKSLEGETAWEGADKYKLEAYHGTPHDFNEFKSSNIGTGEGFQAYGWGLYFAGNKGIAEWYRDKLSKPGQQIYVTDKEGNEVKLDVLAHKHGSGATGFIKQMMNNLSPQEWKDTTVDDVTFSLDEEIGMSGDPEYDAELTALRDDLENFDSVSVKTGSKGKLYTVDIDTETEHMLDWDKPLSEQSDYVKAALPEISKPEAKTIDDFLETLTGLNSVELTMVGLGFDNFLESRDMEIEDWAGEMDETLTADQLRDNITQYIKRQDPEIVQEYIDENLSDLGLGLPEDPTGEELYRYLSEEKGSDKQASIYLNSLGIPGLKYLDATSRRLGEGSYNFVVFDESKAKIIDKYKIAAEHTTPHRFDAFDHSKMGTGEGAQVYGWGTYLSTSDEVREHYRKTLEMDTIAEVTLPSGKTVESKFGSYGEGVSEAEKDALAMLDTDDYELRKVVNRIEENLHYHSGVKAIMDAYDVLKQMKPSDIKILSGKTKTLKVDIDAEIEHMLDWDSNMRDQTNYVQERLRDAASTTEYEKAMKAFRSYDEMLYEKYGEDYENRTDAEEAEYEKLNAEVAKHKTAGFLDTNLDDTKSGRTLYADLVWLRGSDKEALYLNSIGIPGIKYLDGVSRRNGKGSYNFVVFDESKMNITDRYKVEPTGVPSVKVNLEEVKAPRDARAWMKNLYRRVVDKNVPLVEADEKTGRLASNASLVSGTVEHIATKALVDTVGNFVGKSWKEVSAPFAENQDFWDYMAQRHNIDRAREGKPVDPNMSSEQSADYAAKIEQTHPEYTEWAESVTGWIDDFMQVWAVDTGIIDADVYAEWRDMYPSYFPTYREFTDLESQGNFGPGKKFIDLPKPVKKATGSDRDLTNPVGNVIQMMNKVVRTARYNEVGSALLESVRSNPEKAKQYAEEIPANVGMFKSVDNVVAIWEDGHPQYLQINNKELLESLNGVPKIINNAQAVRKITNVYKGLITQYNPLFALRNIFRDIPTAYVYGSQDNPLVFLKNLVNAGYEIVTETGGAARYKALGGGGSGQFSADEAAQYAKLLQPSTASKLRLPLKAIEFFNNLTEQAPRVSEFNYVLDQTGDVSKALYAAQNVTVNFARGGDITKQVEPFVPYLNASVQGIDRFFQAFNFKKDPQGAFKRLVKSGIAITLPQLASYLISAATDDEAYKALDQRTKDSSYVFPKGDGSFWKIPKSRELGVLFGSLFERVLARDFEGFGGTVATNFLPVNPFENNLAAPLVLNLPMNVDFAGRKIVPEYMRTDRRSPRYQYDDNTSEIAKAIGDKTNLSPKQLDYIMRSYSGVVGQFLLPATTKRTGAGSAVKRMTVGAFTADPAFSSQAMTDFYDKLDVLAQEKTDKNIKEDLPDKAVTMEELKYNAMNKIAANITKTTKYVNANLATDDDKVRELREILNRQLKRAAAAETPAELVKINYELSSALYKAGVR